MAGTKRASYIFFFYILTKIHFLCALKVLHGALSLLYLLLINIHSFDWVRIYIIVNFSTKLRLVPRRFLKKKKKLQKSLTNFYELLHEIYNNNRV